VATYADDAYSMGESDPGGAAEADYADGYSEDVGDWA
jgi:hypothetical protein